VDLDARPWESLVDDEQSQPRLLRRLCAAVHQVQREGAAAPATCAAIAVAQRKHVDCFDAGRPCQHIEMAHCPVAVEVTSEVERGSRRVRHGHPVDQDQLVIADQLVACEDPAGWSGRRCDEFDGRARVDPKGAMECGRRPSGDDATSTRPEPGTHRVLPQRWRVVVGDVDVGVDRLVIPPQSAAGEDAPF
jgi:hypothetical protein